MDMRVSVQSKARTENVREVFLDKIQKTCYTDSGIGNA